VAARKVLAYTRVSTQNRSTVRSRSAVEGNQDYAKANGLRLVRTLSDEASPVAMALTPRRLAEALAIVERGEVAALSFIAWTGSPETAAPRDIMARMRAAGPR